MREILQKALVIFFEDCSTLRSRHYEMNRLLTEMEA